MILNFKTNIKDITLYVVILWVINEIIQFFFKSDSCDFFILHVSSFYGAIIFCFCIYKLKYYPIFYLTPIVIELIYNYLIFKCVDYVDILFSISGILFSLLIIHKNINNE
jgi:hypothetical protein